MGDETCVPADCSSTSTSEPTTTTTTNGTVSTTFESIAQTTLPTLILTTTPAGPIDCLLVMTTALSERSVDIQKGIEEGLTHGGIQAQGVFFVGIQNQLLLLAAIKRELEEEHQQRS